MTVASLRAQILAAKHAALDAPEKPAGCTVTRGRLDPFTADELPALNIRPAKEPAQGAPRGLARKLLVLAVDVYAAGDPVDDALDPLLAWATAAVMADPRTGGLSVDIREHELEWHPPGALSQSYGGATVFFLVDYVQAAANAAAHA